MYEHLRELQLQGKMAAVYTNEEKSDIFAVGYIKAINGGHFLMLCVGLHGEFDGYAVMEADEVFRIETDTNYLHRMNTLCEKNFIAVQSVSLDGDLLIDLLEYSKANGVVLKLKVRRGDFEAVGIVSQIGDGSVVITQYDMYGKYDGETVIEIGEIYKAIVYDGDCRDVELLREVGDNRRND